MDGSGPLPPLSEIIAVGAYWQQVGRYSAVAVYALAVYDWLVSIEDEYDLIHTASWTSIKIAYLICRYYPLIIYPVYLWAWLSDHSFAFCNDVVHPLYGLSVIFTLSAQAVVLMRVYAFTGRKTIVLLLLGACYLTLAGAEIWLFGTQFVSVPALYVLLGDAGCFANDMHAESGSLFQYVNATSAGLVILGAFLMDLIMMLLVLLHCLRLRSTQGPLGKAFVMQGAGAFLLISSLNLLTAIIYLRPDRRYDGIGLPLLLVLSDVTACRLILSLRRHVRPTDSELSRLQSGLVRDALELLQAESTDHRTTSIERVQWA